jgi:hypothetical protein
MIATYREAGTLTHQALRAWFFLSRGAGEGGERSEAGDGLLAVTHKFDQFALHTAARRSRHSGDRMNTVVQLSGEILLQIRCRCSKRRFADSIGNCGSQGIYCTAEDRGAS